MFARIMAALAVAALAVTGLSALTGGVTDAGPGTRPGHVVADGPLKKMRTPSGLVTPDWRGPGGW